MSYYKKNEKHVSVAFHLLIQKAPGSTNFHL